MTYSRSPGKTLHQTITLLPAMPCGKGTEVVEQGTEDYSQTYSTGLITLVYKA